MSVEIRKRQIEMDGFCIIEDVIPTDEIKGIRDEITALERAGQEESEALKADMRRRGHRIGAKGVGSLRQVINRTQSFAPHLADRRILETAEAVLGPWARISCTDCVVNFPGNERGYWHADWPYNQTNASHIPAPYPDTLLHLSTIWMLTPFSAHTGGTFVVPGSHRWLNNPSADGIAGIDRDAPHRSELQIEGEAGSVLLYDSRMWHAVAPNLSQQPRVALVVRYAPWWLNLNPTLTGRPEHSAMVVETGGKNYEMPPVKKGVYEALPDDVKPLYRHWVD